MVQRVFSDDFSPSFFSGYEKRNEVRDDDCVCRDDDVSCGESYRSFCTRVNNTHKALSPDECISIHQFADFFEHLESAVMAIWIVGAFVKISVFYYASALGTAQWLNLSDYRPVVWPIGILIVEFSFWSFPSSMDVSRNDINVFPFQGILMQTIIPLLLLLIAVVRKRNKGTETR